MSKWSKINHILSAPWRYGQQKPGVDLGAPSLLKMIQNMQQNVSQNSFHNKERRNHLSTILNSETHLLDGKTFLKSNSMFHESLYLERKRLLGNTLVIGGDHSVAIGSVLGTLAIHQKGANYFGSQYYDYVKAHENDDHEIHVLSGAKHEQKRKSGLKTEYEKKYFKTQTPRLIENSLFNQNHTAFQHNSSKINQNVESYQDHLQQQQEQQQGKKNHDNGVDKDKDTDNNDEVGFNFNSFEFNQSNVGVIWIDAHADINTLTHSHSGNIHGMPLSFITGIENDWRWIAEIDKENKLKFGNLYYWGIRDVDQFETDIISKYNIKVLNNVNEIIQVVNNYDLIHTSLDIDSMDPQWAPSTGTKVANGLHVDDVLFYLNFVKNSGKSICIDLVEYNPDIGTEMEKIQTQQTMEKILHVLF